MCLVIDTNTLSSVFDKTAVNHSEFKPVYDWVINGKGKVVFGGSKYKKELRENYIKLFVLLRSQNKAVSIDDHVVDELTKVIEKKIVHKDFDDQHIVSLLIASKCRLICSSDKRAYPYFRHSLFFSPAKNKPRIYSSKATAHLLCDRFIADVCDPCVKVNNSTKEIIDQALQILNKTK